MNITRYPSVIIIFILTLSCVTSYSQKLYHRARVDLKGKNIFLLTKAGIATDHGKIALGRYFESDFEEGEIELIKDLGFNVDIKIRDVASYYASEDRPSEMVVKASERFTSCKKEALDIKTPFGYFDGSMGGYLTYDEMILAIENLSQSYPNIVSKIDTVKGFTTIDGNKILYLKISDNPNLKEDEPQILYTALHHAREPNSLSQMIFYLNYLCENYTTNKEIKHLVDNTEMVFVPCVNPDGYKYNQKNNPNGGGMWRKNTRKNSSGVLTGVDLNRNYGFRWGNDNIGSSPNPASETYRGTSAFSEVETSAVRELMKNNKFLISLNYHTFGNLLVHPWGYADGPTDEDNIFKAMGRRMTRFNDFTLGTGSETVGYTVNGDADDYMYGERIEKNKVFSMTPEVGPSFWPKKSEIDQLNKSCLEMNLTAPRLANGYLFSDLVNRNGFYDFQDFISLKISKPSFKSGPVELDIYTDRILSTERQSLVIDLKQGKDTVINVEYKINPVGLQTGRNEVYFYISQDFGGFKYVDSVKIDIFKGDRKSIFTDKAFNLQNFTTNWGLNTVEEYLISSPSSFTDSPSATYKSNTKNKFILKNPIDLTEVVSPYLTYSARWNIEADFDYARVFVFTKGGDTINLCGAYTTTGQVDQLLGEPVYEGMQNEFVKEVLSLEEFIGTKELYIGFEMVSDGALNLDGMYIDDIEVVSFTQSGVSNKETKDSYLKIHPNPTSGIIHFEDVVAQGVLEIFTLDGRKIEELKLNHDNHVSLRHLNEGVYITKLHSQSKIATNKVIIIK